MFHVAPTEARAQIESEGLRTDAPSHVRDAVPGEYPSGVYLWENVHSAYNWIQGMILFYPDPGCDILEVTVDGLELHPDPRVPAFFTSSPIGPERVSYYDSTTTDDLWDEREEEEELDQDDDDYLPEDG